MSRQFQWTAGLALCLVWVGAALGWAAPRVGRPAEDLRVALDRDQDLVQAAEQKYLQPGHEHKVVRYEGYTAIAADTYIDGDVVVLRGDIEIEGEIGGTVIAILGDVIVGRWGVIHGDVVSVGGEVHVHRRAVVDGDVVEATVEALRSGNGEESRRVRRQRWGRGAGRRVWSREFWDEDQQVVLLRYNRVEGLFAGLRLPRNFNPRQQVVDFGLYGEAGYGFRSKAWRYRLGGEFSAFSGPPRGVPFLMTLGAEVHDLTDTQDRWIIPEMENSLSAFLFKRDYMDFYRRGGWSIYVTQRVAGVLSLTGRFASDDFYSLPNRTNWALFGGPDFRPNPAIDEGRIISLRGELRLDTRNSRQHPHQGWLIQGLAERAGGVFGGEYDFQRYLVDLRRYQPLTLGDRLDVRLRVGTARGPLPRQYMYDLGGLSTLRGYGFKEFTGDRFLLGNVEYWVNADQRLGGAWLFGDLNLVFLFDAGLAWFADDPSSPLADFSNLGNRNIRTSAGLAIASDSGNFRIELVKRLDRGGERVSVRFRASRPF